MNKIALILTIVLCSSYAYALDTNPTISTKKMEVEIIKSEIDIFAQLTKANNKVFIESADKNAVIHATKAIGKWKYWVITENKEEADFILKFTYQFVGLGDVFGYAEFISPKNGDVLKTTKEVNSIMSMDFNSKRAVLNKIIKKEIKPLFHK